MEREPTATDRADDRAADRQPGRRRFGCLRRLGMALLVIFVVLAIPWTYFNITLGLKLERELEAIRARGEPLTLEQAAPQMPPPEENAALIYNQIFRLENWAFTSELERPPEDPTPSLLGQVPEEFSGTNDNPDQFPDPDAILRQAMHDPSLQRIFDLLEQAAARPKCAFDIPWEDGPAVGFPHMTMFRECARWLMVRVRLAAEDGEAAEAAKWLRVSLRMSEHVRESPTLVGQLVSYAISAMMMDVAEKHLLEADVPGDAAQRLVAGTDTGLIAPAFATSVVYERAWSYDVFDWLERAGNRRQASLNILGENTWSRLLLRLYLSPVGLPLRKYDRITYLETRAEEIELLALPYRSIPPGPREEGVRLADEHPLAALTIRRLPVFTRAAAKRDHAIAQTDQFHIALALNLYRQAHGGYPETLEPLAAVVDWPIPDDIFSGEPFRYRREGEGYVLWSLGPDLDDDGGHDYREEGRSRDDSDIVWRAER